MIITSTGIVGGERGNTNVILKILGYESGKYLALKENGQIYTTVSYCKFLPISVVIWSSTRQHFITYLRSYRILLQIRIRISCTFTNRRWATSTSPKNTASTFLFARMDDLRNRKRLCQSERSFLCGMLVRNWRRLRQNQQRRRPKRQRPNPALCQRSTTMQKQTKTAKRLYLQISKTLKVTFIICFGCRKTDDNTLSVCLSTFFLKFFHRHSFFIALNSKYTEILILTIF